MSILSENSCHFVNLLSFASSSFFLSLRKITWLNSQQPKTRVHVEHLGLFPHVFGLLKVQRLISFFEGKFKKGVYSNMDSITVHMVFHLEFPPLIYQSFMVSSLVPWSIHPCLCPACSAAVDLYFQKRSTSRSNFCDGPRQPYLRVPIQISYFSL